MRTLTFLMVSGALMMGASGPALASPPASGTIVLRATATFSDGSSADRLYSVRRDADSDGDGIGDEAWLRVRCADGAVAAAFEYDVKSPRDTATGQASGKRQHKPFTITKEWDASTPMLKTGAGGGGGGGVVGKTLGWDLATGKGARSTGSGQARSTGSGQARSTGSGQARIDHSGASDASAGKGAKDVDRSRASNDTAGRGAAEKTMAHDSWMTVTLKEGSPNLCD